MPSPERIYPAPTSTIFTPAPFALPTDGPSFWQALEQITERLEPATPEIVRLQACDHLARLADLVMSDDTRDYEIYDAALLEFQGVAFRCQDEAVAQSSYDRLRAVLQRNPYR